MALEKINMVRKWTTAVGGFDKPALQEIVKKEKAGKAVPIFLVLALISRVKEESSKLKADKLDYRFGGQFEVKNLHTEEVIHSGEAYFPGPSESLALQAYDAGRAAEGVAQSLAFTITVEKDESKNSATGYKFGALALVNKEAGDPFKGLREEAVKSLPAPKK